MNANAACWFVDRHLHEGRAEKAAFVEGDRRLGYGELAERSDRMAGLLARHGVRPEERAALIALDTLDWPVIFWGCLKAGVVPVAINTLLTTDQYRHVLADSRARALFVSAPLLEAVRPALGDLPHLREMFVIGADPGNGGDPAWHDFAAELAASGPVPAVEAGLDDCAFWLYSSGSTGQPKGVRHVHSSMRGSAETYGAQVLGIREDDVVFSAGQALLRLRPRQLDELPHVGGRDHGAAAGAADAGSGLRRAAGGLPDDLLRRADALRRHAGGVGRPNA